MRTLSPMGITRRKDHAPRRWWFWRTGLPGHLEFLPLKHGVPLLACTAIWLGTHFWRVRRPPMSVVWNEVDEHGAERVNDADRWARRTLKWNDTLRARHLSNVLAHGVVPGGTLSLAVLAGLKGGGGPFADVLVANEAMVYAGTLSQIAKLLFRRQRPFGRFAPQGSTAPARQPDDDNLSFFSSHTATTTAFAFAAAEIVTRRAVRTPLVLLMAIAAGATGYLRIASDRHYLTDVLTGYAVGAAVGTLTPRLLHPVRTPKRRLDRLRRRLLRWEAEHNPSWYPAALLPV
ncbi:phosphatase PAP2 family protein [Vulgatibacter sp.]|uniref:phosphatase PAP2 family protein n=1 Tax=Vulgatibacter sp. TaxID=1971226 RepID=UPI003564D0DE